jgi:hypothetical protein
MIQEVSILELKRRLTSRTVISLSLQSVKYRVWPSLQVQNERLPKA